MKLFLLLFLSLSISAQTSYGEEEITTAATHDQQWLLTNTVTDNMSNNHGIINMVQPFIKKQTTWAASAVTCRSNCKKWVHQSNTPSKLKKRNLTYTVYYKQLPNRKWVSTKVVFEGSKDLVIDFFMNYWTEDLEFTEDSNNSEELASARFLTDIATLRINKEGDASIIVHTGTAKKTFTNTISSN